MSPILMSGIWGLFKRKISARDAQEVLIFPVGTGFFAPLEIFPRFPTASYGRLFFQCAGRGAQCAGFCARRVRILRVLRMRMRAQKVPVFPINTGFFVPWEIFRKRKENKRKERNIYIRALCALLYFFSHRAVGILHASPTDYT